MASEAFAGEAQCTDSSSSSSYFHFYLPDRQVVVARRRLGDAKWPPHLTAPQRVPLFLTLIVAAISRLATLNIIRTDTQAHKQELTGSHCHRAHNSSTMNTKCRVCLLSANLADDDAANDAEVATMLMLAIVDLLVCLPACLLAVPKWSYYVEPSDVSAVAIEPSLAADSTTLTHSHLYSVDCELLLLLSFFLFIKRH